VGTALGGSFSVLVLISVGSCHGDQFPTVTQSTDSEYHSDPTYRDSYRCSDAYRPNREPAYVCCSGKAQHLWAGDVTFITYKKTALVQDFWKSCPAAGRTM